MKAVLLICILGLVQGDAGSWVIHNERLCGMVIAASESFPWAYMLPIHSLFDSMKVSGLEARVPSWEDVEKLIGDEADSPCEGDIETEAESAFEQSTGLGEQMTVLSESPKVQAPSVDNDVQARTLDNDGANRASAVSLSRIQTVSRYSKHL